MIDELNRLINESNNIVFFGGAGVSTESGIKDFRSKDGLYNMKYKFPPEEILSHHFFMNHTKDFYDFYKDKMNCLDKAPNSCHFFLKQLEDNRKLKAIITQNIDGLHQKAGSRCVYELHGSIYRNYCMKCLKKYTADYVFSSDGIPRCSCGGIIKPNVVLYEEPLDDYTVDKSIEAIKNADLLIVAGTSLTVYPASSFINFFNGKNLVIINNDYTNYDDRATLVIHDSISNVLSKIKIQG